MDGAYVNDARGYARREATRSDVRRYRERSHGPRLRMRPELLARSIHVLRIDRWGVDLVGVHGNTNALVGGL